MICCRSSLVNCLPVLAWSSIFFLFVFCYSCSGLLVLSCWALSSSQPVKVGDMTFTYYRIRAPAGVIS